MVPTQCPHDETLLRYANGDLDDTVADSIDSHLSACTLCLTRMEEVSQRDALFSELRKPSRSTPAALKRAVSAVLQDIPASVPVAGATSNRIAGYTLMKEVGRGGMGQVYRAHHPRLNVEVAIKLLRPGHDTDKLKARFETERETLARMDHPNIAKVFDAGVSEDDRPYIVMEYVRGQTLAALIERNEVTLTTRLQLFRQICQAIQHAHQKGIIHRDIKPSNVLLTEHDGRLVPKVIDFGVARAVNSESTRHTAQGLVVGTPEYLSPEQTGSSVDAIDTRSDIHTLGVLLYELVTGDTPTAIIAGKSVPVLEVMRIIREVDPPPPSGRATVAYPSSRVRDELDWITLKALEKDPARRYQSASELSDDVGRLLADEAVLAAPASRSYRLRKLVRRNRAAAIGGISIVLALCAGIVGTTWQMLRAMNAEQGQSERAEAAIRAEANEKESRQQAERAEANERIERGKATVAEAKAKADRELAVEAEADAEAFNNYLLGYVIAAARPNNAKLGLGPTVSLAKAMSIAEEKIPLAFKGRPNAELKARIQLGETWIQLRNYENAEKNILRAIEILAIEPVKNEMAILDCRIQLMKLYNAAHRFENTRTVGDVVLPKLLQFYEPRHEKVLKAKMYLGWCYHELGQAKNALELSKESLDGYFATRGARDKDTLIAMNNYAGTLQSVGKIPEAKKLLETILKTRRETLGMQSDQTISAASNLSVLMLKTNQIPDATELLEEFLPHSRSLMGNEHPTTISILVNLGSAYLASKRRNDAIQKMEEARDLCLKHRDSDLAEKCHIYERLASAYHAVQRMEEAIQFAEMAYRGRKTIYQVNHPTLWLTGHNLGLYYLDDDRYPDAIDVFEDVLNRKIALNDPNNYETLVTTNFLAISLLLLDRPAQAESWLKKCVKYAETAENKNGMGQSIVQLYARCLVKRGEYTEAERLLRIYIPKGTTTIAAKNLTQVYAIADLGQCLAQKREFLEAAVFLNQSCRALRTLYPTKNHITYEMIQTAHQRLADLFTAWDKPAEAAKVRQVMAQLHERAPRPRAVP